LVVEPKNIILVGKLIWQYTVTLISPLVDEFRNSFYFIFCTVNEPLCDSTHIAQVEYIVELCWCWEHFNLCSCP